MSPSASETLGWHNMKFGGECRRTFLDYAFEEPCAGARIGRRWSDRVADTVARMQAGLESLTTHRNHRARYSAGITSEPKARTVGTAEVKAVALEGLICDSLGEDVSRMAIVPIRAKTNDDS